MMKRLAIIVLLIFGLTACEKNSNEEVLITDTNKISGVKETTYPEYEQGVDEDDSFTKGYNLPVDEIEGQEAEIEC